jgi:diketogulonate reductase-like aldo/keto reductase
MTRREATRLIAGGAAGFIISPTIRAAETSMLLQRAIPSSGERLPVIGLGTARVFDVNNSPNELSPLEEVMSLLVKRGGKMVDTSPMYGRSEAVIGEIATTRKLHDSLFLATKVWTTGRDAGIRQMEKSAELLGTKTLDLIQVHNLIDTATHLATLREWKKEGRLRYFGITHHTEGSQDEVAAWLQKERVDFVQINYSLIEREAEKRVFPVANDRGVAVIVNRPFGAGDLFSRVRNKPLPDFTREIDCTSWAQFFLKWIVAHPAVTCVIPATSNPRHMEDDLLGGIGPLPDEKMRQRMVETVAAL